MTVELAVLTQLLAAAHMAPAAAGPAGPVLLHPADVASWPTQWPTGSAGFGHEVLLPQQEQLALAADQ